jgi:phage gpG-like protein
MPYAAMQNFGGTKAEFPHLWGDIPARAFFPDKARGLPDDYNKEISAVLRAALQNATKR